MNSDLFSHAHACLLADDPDTKLRLTHACANAWYAGKLVLEPAPPPQPLEQPGRPPRPLLVSPRELPRRNLNHPQGRAALFHALCHIEFNAINLAWDAVYRFRGLPFEYYNDWARVAEEEALHFGLLRQHLRGLGHDYGDFPAHNGLWQMALETAHDPLARMALVPRTMEARGLDVTPGLIGKLQEAGDARAVEVLQIILHDEIGHVAAGSRWFHYLCAQRQLEPEAEFRRLLGEHLKGRPRPPFHTQARLSAGFSPGELAWLRQQAGAGEADAEA